MAKTKSGSYWVTWANAYAKNSTSINDLEMNFRLKVQAFVKALEDAGITVAISATKRSEKRAYLFHWCWKISQDKVLAADVPAMAGVEIEWDHGTAAASKAGAQQMVTGFGLAVPPNSTNPPSLVSNHISGKGIDMTLTWTGSKKIKKKDGVVVDVAFNSNVNLNTALHAVGLSYGVKKLTTDKPHWSYNGG
jgi:hypothetical protein